MAIADIERLHQRLGVRLGTQPSVFSAPIPLLEYFIGTLSGNPPPVPSAPTGDWWQLINLTYPHKLIPLFFLEAEKLPPDNRPPELVMRQLKRLYVESRLRGLMMEAQLKDALPALTAAGVETLVFKGLALSYGYYPDPASRPATDIDLLVTREHFPIAKKALIKMGYRDIGGRFETLPYFTNESSFVNAHADYRIDLHWAMHPCNRVDREREVEGLMERSIMVPGRQFPFRALRPADEFIQSVRHMTWNHLDAVRLMWIWDLMEMGRRLDAEQGWQEVHDRTAELHLGAATWLALDLVRVWTGFSPAAPFGERDAWPLEDAFEHEVWSRMRASSGNHWGRLWLAWNPNWALRYKLDFGWRLLFPPAELMRKNYPPSRPWLLPFSYLRRWFRAARTFLGL